MIGLIVVVVIIIIVFNIFLFSGAKKEIMDEKGVDSWKDVTGELDKSNLKDIDASLYILYCIAIYVFVQLFQVIPDRPWPNPDVRNVSSPPSVSL